MDRPGTEPRPRGEIMSTVYSLSHWRNVAWRLQNWKTAGNSYFGRTWQEVVVVSLEITCWNLQKLQPRQLVSQRRFDPVTY